MKCPDINELSGRNNFNKFLKDNYSEFYQYLLNNYPEDLSMPQRLYWYYHNITTHPTCPVCGSTLRFYSFGKGYQMFCSYSCAANSEYKIDKMKKTCLEKYGGIGFASEQLSKLSKDTMEYKYGDRNPLNIKQFKDKKNNTMIERYGVVHRLQDKEYSDKLHIKMQQSIKNKYGEKGIFGNKDVQSKIKKTNLEKYGGVGFASAELANKVKKICLEKYGNKIYTQSQEYQSRHEEILNKTKQTCLEKYGVENPSKSQTVRNKVRQTCLERYGVENPIQSESIKNKSKQTCLERYGVEHYSQSEEFQNKVRQTCLEKYGTEHYNQSAKYQSRHDEIQTKSKQTCLERYGSEYYTQSQERLSRHDEIQTKINNTKHLNHTFNSSQIETEFATYLTSQNIEYIRQYRSKEYPFNCDFYLPKYDLYIEIQAGWFHGGHPFNIEMDKNILERWKSKNTDFYKKAIEVWTERDVNKRNIAKQNQLNYLEIFSNDIDRVAEIFENFIFSISGMWNVLNPY